MYRQTILECSDRITYRRIQDQRFQTDNSSYLVSIKLDGQGFILDVFIRQKLQLHRIAGFCNLGLEFIKQGGRKMRIVQKAGTQKNNFLLLKSGFFSWVSEVRMFGLEVVIQEN